MNIVLKFVFTIVMMLVWGVGKEVAQKIQGSGFGFLTFIVSAVCMWIIYEIWFGVLFFKKSKDSDGSVSNNRIQRNLKYTEKSNHYFNNFSNDNFTPVINDNIFQKNQRNESENSDNLNFKIESINEDDEIFYLYAAKEFDNKNTDDALWAKCITLCEGDESRAKYMYTQKRVEILKKKYFKKFNNQNDKIGDDKLIIFGVVLFLIFVISFLILI